jgi:hypothetical protein
VMGRTFGLIGIDMSHLDMNGVSVHYSGASRRG